MANVKDLIVNGAARVIGKLYASEFVGKLTGNVTGDVSGNATSATKLETERSLKITDGTNTSDGVNFNGTSNVTLKLPTTIKATFSGNLTGNVTGNVSGSSGSCTGNAATASVINGTYTGNGGAQPPSYIGSGKVRFNMMNQFSGLSSLPNYADCILMDTYTGSDVPYVTGLGIIKADGNPRAFIAVGDKGNTTTWKSQAELITTANVASSHSHSYLPLSGGTLSNDAVISWANSGTWDVSSSPKGLIGGLSWSGQSDYISLRASENAADNLELILKFGDDNSNGLTIQNASEVKTARITAGGIIEANEFKGNLTGNATTATTATTATNSTKLHTVTRSTNADHFLTFVDSNNSSAASETVYTNGSLKYNPSTNTLTATTFSGNATTATSATNDSNGNRITSTYLPLSGGTMTGTIMTRSNTGPALNLRNESTYMSTINYDTSGNEALAINLKNTVTSFMVNHGVDGSQWTANGKWTSVTPTLQAKNKCVYINELIPNGTSPSYNLKVNGTSYFSNKVYIGSSSSYISYNNSTGALEFNC